VVGKWVIEPQASLAWWQVNPHLNHLWATTCPGDAFWMPGDGNTGGWKIDLSLLPADYGFTGNYYRGSGRNLSPPEHIPLFHRKDVQRVCGEAVHGEVVMRDASGWRSITGNVVVDAGSLETGSDIRDGGMHSILETMKYPTLSFRLDSLEDIQPGDTLRATAVGIFTLRDIGTPVSVPVKVWRDAGGLRVVGKFMIPTDALLTTYHMSAFKLGLGVAHRLWRELHMGFDLVLVPPPA